jgi:hypothetical protein
MCVSVANADDTPEWKKKYPTYEVIAEKKIELDKGKDSIAIGGDKAYNGLLITVENKLEMYDIKVKYQDNTEYAPGIRHTFREGERSRQFDLPGGAKKISEVSFYYSSDDKKGKTTVKICGAGIEGPVPMGIVKLPESKDGWHYLGSTDADLASDKKKIDVPEAPTRFIAIFIGVPSADLEMWDVKTEFGSGDTHNAKDKLKFNSGNRGRIVDLPSDNKEGRKITKVNFSYKGATRSGRVTVKFWGRPADTVKRYDGFKHIGSAVIDLTKDNGSVTCGASKGKFKNVYVEVENADCTLSDVTFIFGNGNEWKAEGQLDYDEVWRYRKVDLAGKETRTIERVGFKIKPKKKQGKAVVNIYGKQID